MNNSIPEIPEALAFGDVLLVPCYSKVLPREVSTKTRLTKTISLNIPLLSAAMDKVTEFKMAISMALEGGMGVIHKALPIDVQSDMVHKVKRHQSDMVTKPFTFEEGQTIADAVAFINENKFSTLPIVNDSGDFVGLVTGHDISFADVEKNSITRLSEIMLPLSELKLAYASDDLTTDNLKQLFKKYRVTKLPVLESKENKKLVGIYFKKDLDNLVNYPNASRDDKGRLRVGAAVGVESNTMERVRSLVSAGVDVVFIDSAHGHSKGVIETLISIKKEFPNLQVVAGNVVTAQGALELIDAGADAIKVGVGPGSICTTREVTGVGVPQFSAIQTVASFCNGHDIPVIADGGISKSGSFVKAIAAGASTIMAGSIFAGTDESPGEKKISAAGVAYKEYRGMGSLEAMSENNSSKDRYFQDGVPNKKLVAEGVSATVPYKGSVHSVIEDYIGGLRQAMGYLGAEDIKTLHVNAKFVRITNAGSYESGVHDVAMLK